MEPREPQIQKPEGEVTSPAPEDISNKTMPSWLSDYLKNNPLTVVWQSALVVGAFILAIHFLYIGFFPDLDWQASLALIGIIALTGLFIWCFISLMLIFPSFVWSTILEDMKEDQPSRKAPPTQAVTGARSGKSPSKSKGDPHKNSKRDWWAWLWRIGLLFGAPTLAFWTVVFVTILFDIETIYDSFWLMTVVLVLLPILVCVPVFLFIDKGVAFGSHFKKIGFGRYFVAVFFGSVVFCAPLFLIYALVYSKYNTSPFNTVSGRLITFSFAILLGFFYNLAAFKRWMSDSKRSRPLSGFLEAFLLGSVILVGLFSATGNSVLIPEGIANLYGIGNMEGATLILDKDGCSMARQMGLGVRAEQDSEWCRLSHIKILNRLGTTYYLRSPRGADFTLPSAAVRSYEIPSSPYVLIHVKSEIEGGAYKLIMLTITNISGTELDDLTVSIEFCDRSGKSCHPESLSLGKLQPNQSHKWNLNVIQPLSAELWLDAAVARYGRQLSYVSK